jgi:DNA-3-methyladenine glycosylase
VYFTYGMHFCFNVVTEEEGTGHAVLLRALEPVTGIDRMMKHRGMSSTRINNNVIPARQLIHLCNGPAKLCQAFGIARAQNGTDLCGNEIWIARDTLPGTRSAGQRARFQIRRSTRIGIAVGREHRWRFYVKGSPWVSRGKPVA